MTSIASRTSNALPFITGPYLAKRCDSCWPCQVGRTLLAHHLGILIAELHNKGVYFRSLHLGNVVQDENGQLGLIDISDMVCSSAPLGRLKRSRNFQHLFRYERDVDNLRPYGDGFIEGYVANLPDNVSDHFRRHLSRLFEQIT